MNLEMLQSTYQLIVLAAFLQAAHGLYGPNACQEQQNYTMTTRVKYQQPVSIKTYRWCLGIPPRCSSTHIEMKEKWKVQTVVRTKTVEFCCEGFEEDEGRCVPKCPAGFTGDLCDEGCPLEKWGPSCTEVCNCPENSICNVKNGSCVCLDGWSGTRCNVPLFPATRMPFPRIDKEILKNTNLFDWDKPTMSDTKTTEKHVTYRNYVLSTTTRYPLVTSSTGVYLDKNYKATNNSIKGLLLPNVQNFTTNKPNIETTTFISSKPTTLKTPSTTFKDILDVVSTTTFKSKIPRVNTTAPTIDKSGVKNNVTLTKPKTIDVTKTYDVPLVNIHKFNSTTTIKPKSDVNITKDIDKKIKLVNISANEDRVKGIDTTKNVTSIVKTTRVENRTEGTDNKRITKVNADQKSQIESPTMITTSPTTTTISYTLRPSTQMSTTISTSTTEKLTTTTKKKPLKQHKSESDILNITLRVLPNRNESGSKMFKTVTLAPVSNTTLKTPQKVKIMHESKMITIPVRVIMDSEKSPSNIFFRKEGTAKKIDKSATMSPMFTLDVQTEETKHVLTEPEQITSVAGDDYDDQARDDILSILTITIGIMVIIIFTATVIVLVTRYRQIKAEKLKNIEMGHVQAMINISEDDMQSGYMRSVFHSPLPDPPLHQHQHNLSKPSFASPILQATLTRPVSPALMESFRDILECHYDHPKPPRPITTSMKIQLTPDPTYQVPPSVYQQLNTFRTSSVGSNQKSDPNDFSLPVTDAAIRVLKLEHQNSQTVVFENKEPVYDEIPPWIIETPKNLNEIMYSNDEAFTEL